MDLTQARITIDQVDLVYCNISELTKVKTMPVISPTEDKSKYISMQNIQKYFGISRYHLIKYLKEIKAVPLGEVKNFENGRQMRGIGQIVYPRAVLNDINNLLYKNANIEAILAMARKILEQ